MPLAIKLNREDGPPAGVVVELSGSLDTATAPELERQLAPVLTGTVGRLTFDLAGLNFITSAGLRVFELSRKALRQRGGQVSFVHLQPQIREVFAVIQSLPGMKVFQNLAELDAYLAARQQSHLEKQ